MCLELKRRGPASGALSSYISLAVGAALFIADLFGYGRSRAQGRAIGDAVAAMLISVGIAVVPVVAVLELADYSYEVPPAGRGSL
jgi:hypothetical protein